MERFEIHGGKRLSGAIEVRGSKNAATPILAATLLSAEKSVIGNVPRIEDVFRMLEILESMGAIIEWQDDRTVTITPKNIDPGKMDGALVKKIRSSILLLGSLPARFDRFTLAHPGGCVIGARPVGTHFDALRKLGVDIAVSEDGKEYIIDASGRKPGDISLREMSVTATENAMMLAAGMLGKSVIRVAATEPHVEDLGRFLEKMGAKISGLGTHVIEIEGTDRLSGAEHAVIPDANEAATFLILGVATRSPIAVINAQEHHLDIVLEKLREFGASFRINKDLIEVIPAERLVAVPKIDTRTYPGIPSDVQAPFGVLASLANGETLIFDTVFEGRFNYVAELEKMRAHATVLNPHQVTFRGPAKLRGTTIRSYDLRAGAALIIAALAADGKTIIEDIYQVDRGYERIEERLSALGADIRRVRS
ncbi:MAG: UDP-N-acetylglucosamine 1-carboxyvinyltransferase [Candidatus Moranbacteria bacterium]|nr:UDP-N-acetylglucosamine 1-carboxyvinyltransferase [Candidatus Moranbacteria bacterium]NTW75365.1 UDP-N-acetylglucosamine 1-carboxyvinyltransferase [Candidatus Moranbacteria bacterium]